MINNVNIIPPFHLPLLCFPISSLLLCDSPLLIFQLKALHYVICVVLSNLQHLSNPPSSRVMMDEQEEGWPLGLRPLNGRIGLVRNPAADADADADADGSLSFTTLFTASPTASDLDTQSSSSLFHERSITLGSLMGIPSLLDLSRRSTRRFTADTTRDSRNSKANKPCFFSLCSKLSTDAIHNTNIPSLAHFLRAERKASVCRTNLRPATLTLPPSSASVGSAAAGGQTLHRQLLRHHGGSDAYGFPLFISRICGQLLE